jgi:hypothetical protein
MTKSEPGSGTERATAPTPVTSTPSSSRSSRRAASRSLSPSRTFPPGNSQSPPCRLSSGRRHTKSRWSRSMTEARTRMGMESGGLLVGGAGRPRASWSGAKVPPWVWGGKGTGRWAIFPGPG